MWVAGFSLKSDRCTSALLHKHTYKGSNRSPLCIAIGLYCFLMISLIFRVASYQSLCMMSKELTGYQIKKKRCLSSSMHLPECLKQIHLEIKNRITNHATDNMVQREIYRVVTREQAEGAAAQLMDINSKILVNRILLFFGVPKEALSNGSAPTRTLVTSQRPCAAGRPCPGKTQGSFRSHQVSALPML